MLYGFGVSIWLNDLFVIYKLVLCIVVGIVWVNCYLLFDNVLLFGGMK